jgi:DNA processing protein
MTDEEKLYWLGFSAFPGIGPLRFKLILEYFGSAKAAWHATREELIHIRLGEKLTDTFIAFRQTHSLDEYQKDMTKKEIRVITLQEAEYPGLLREISDAPFLLYVRGGKMPADIFSRTVAVVGTRKATVYGREITRRIAGSLASSGVTIVSGLAMGVDTVAHEATLEVGGRTVAVLGCGVDVIHPPCNTTLYWKIVKRGGWVISEFPIGQYALKGLFPARNRIISGLSLGTLVTEGASDSGALITARYAAEQGRDVFAVPGPITSEFSAAPTILLKQGAKLITSGEEIVEELKLALPRQSAYRQVGQAGNHQINQLSNNPIHRGNMHTIPINTTNQLTKAEQKIVDVLRQEMMRFDELVVKTGLSASVLAGIISSMEIRLIITSTDGVYSLRK